MKTAILTFLGLFIINTSFANTRTVKTSISLFRLDTSRARHGRGYRKSMTMRVRKTVRGMKRFKVTDFPGYCFGQGDIPGIIKALKTVVTTNTKPGIFLPADLREIQKTRALVLPIFREIDYYMDDDDKNNIKYAATIIVRLVIIDVKLKKVSEIRDAKIRNIGTSSSRAAAVRAAMGMTGVKLGHVLKKVNLFKLRTAIAGIMDSVATINIGKDFGLSAGDEFSLEKFDSDGKAHESGLLRLFTISSNYSKGLILWGDMHEGSKLVEYPVWLVYLFAGYGQMKFEFQGDDFAPALVLGAGLHIGYNWKGYIHLNIGYQQDLVGVTGDFGVARRFYTGRFSFDLGAAITFGSVKGDAEDRFGTIHTELKQQAFGGTLHGSVNLHLSRKLILQLNAGYRLVFMRHESEYDTEYDTYPELKADLMGPFSSLTLTFRL